MTLPSAIGLLVVAGAGCLAVLMLVANALVHHLDDDERGDEDQP